MAKLARFLWPRHIPLVVRLLFWAGILLALGTWLSRHWYQWGQSASHATMSIAAALFALSAIINGQTARFQAIRSQGHHPFHPVVRILLWVGALSWLAVAIWSESTGVYPPLGDLDRVAISLFILGLNVNGLLLHTRQPNSEAEDTADSLIWPPNFLRLLPWVGWYLMFFQYQALGAGWCDEDCRQIPFKLGMWLTVFCYLWDWGRALRRRRRLARAARARTASR